MSLFLFKPHVEGPEGQVTTPDIVIDRVFVDGGLRSVNTLTSETYFQTEADAVVTPAIAVTALGGGALIGPAAVLGSGFICAGRRAWRLNNLDDHIAKITLNGASLADIGLPSDLIASAGGSGDTLPRGYMLLKTAKNAANEITLSDGLMKRELSLRIVAAPAEHDRWGDARPKPRYSVGPTQKDVQHFI